MSHQWLRLWHDLPNDPKWIVIAKKSEQPISLVISVYLHMLINASKSKKRGTLEHWCDDDVAAALHVEPNAIERIRTHMNGKVLLGAYLTGWEARQPRREDGSAERAKAWRENNKENTERNRTQPNATERPDKDTDKEKRVAKATLPPTPLPDWLPVSEWGAFKEMRKGLRSPMTEKAEQLAIGQLDKLRHEGHDPKLVIEQSILRNWKSFYQLKGDDNAKRSFKSEGQRLAAKYRADAEHEEQSAASRDSESGLRITENIRQD